MLDFIMYCATMLGIIFTLLYLIIPLFVEKYRKGLHRSIMSGVILSTYIIKVIVNAKMHETITVDIICSIIWLLAFAFSIFDAIMWNIAVKRYEEKHGKSIEGDKDGRN